MCKSGYFTAHFRLSFFRLRFLFPVLIVLARFATSALGQVVIPLQDLSPDLFKILENNFLLSIEAVGDQLLIGTAKGLWVLNRDGNAHKVEGPNGYSLRVATVGNQLFIGSNNGLWIVGKDRKATKVLSSDARVSDLTAVGDQLLVQTAFEVSSC